MAADRNPDVVESRFRAMGSDVSVIVIDGPDDALDLARLRIDRLERSWSRFLVGSDVSVLNRNAGIPVEVSPDTVLLVELAIEAWWLTGGMVDPLVLGAVIRAGYDRTFETISDRSTAPESSLALLACTDIVVSGSTVTLPAGTGFDAGGIGKGLAADLVVCELRAAGAAGACVNLGGDLRVSGTGPGGDGWTVAIERPDDAETIVHVGIAEGGLATSTTRRRRWRIGERELHHLIDPATGEPSDTDLVQASTISAEAWLSEAYAKAALLRGSDRSFDPLPSCIGAMTVADDGRIAATPAFTAYLDGAELPGRVSPSGTMS